MKNKIKSSKAVKHTVKSVARHAAAEDKRHQATAAKKAKAAAKSSTAKAPAPRDALGGRIGTTCSSVNAVVIKAGKAGVTLAECVGALGIQHQLCSSQLVSLFKRKLATRAEETVPNGKRVVFRYVMVPVKKEAA